MEALDGPLKGKLYRDIPEETKTIIDHYRNENFEIFEVEYERTDEGWKFVKDNSNDINMKKKNYFIKSTDELTQIYIRGLEAYVKNRLGKNEMHMEDFAVEAANFAECFYATILALPRD